MYQQPILHQKDDHRLMRIASATTAAILLRVVLDLVYVHYVTRYFGGTFTAGRFSIHEIDPFRVFASYVIALLLALWLVSSLHRRWRPSGIVLVLYFAVVMLPLSSLYGLAGAAPSFVYAAVGSFAILLLTTELTPRAKFPRPGRDFIIIGTALLVCMSFYVYGMLFLTGGMERLNFNLRSVYQIRAEFVQTKGPFMGYFIPWQAHVVNILLLCYGLYRKHWPLIVFASALQAILFGMTGFKAFLLAPFFALGVYMIWQRRNALLYIFGGTIVLISASYFVFITSEDHLVASILIRRLFFVPAANHLIYYDFFSQPGHPFVMLSNSVLAPFLSYPYDMPLPKVISWTYWGKESSPNVGYLADAYAHFGFTGMFLFSIILGLFLRIVDSVETQSHPNLGVAVIATPALALTNSGLFTSLLTHGLILAAALLWLLSSREARRSWRPDWKGLSTYVPRQRVETAVSNGLWRV